MTFCLGIAVEEANLTFNLFPLIGGQMPSDSVHKLFLVYPEGNWVEVGPDTPYQIIGASGYGKPNLERSVTRSDSMSYAFKVGLLAFDATRLCTRLRWSSIDSAFSKLTRCTFQ